MQGLQGLFAGNGTNVLRIFPTSALVCLVYSRMIKVCESTSFQYILKIKMDRKFE